MTRYKKTRKTVKTTPVAPNGAFGQALINAKEIKMRISTSKTKFMNTFGWFCQEISFNEPKTLICQPMNFFDYACMRGLQSAYDYILLPQNINKQINVPEICNIHYLICNKNNVKINDTFIHAGVIRKTNVPMEIENKLFNIIQKSDNFDFYTAFDIHYELIALQPFDDYNKRTARMIMNWIFIKNGFPPIAFTRKSDKTNYQSALLKMKNGDKKSYYRYMTNAMISSQEKIINELKRSQVR